MTRNRRLTMFVYILAIALVAAALLLSRGVMIRWVSPRRSLLIELYGGAVSVGWPTKGLAIGNYPPTRPGFHILRMPRRVLLLPRTLIGPDCFRYVSAPLWIPLVLLLAVATIRRPWKAREPPSGCCRLCGYDLTGNVSGTCPECGSIFITRRDGDGS